MIASATRTTMRAIVCRRPVSPEDLSVEELDRPAVPAGGLLVRVHASSANPVDLFDVSLLAYLMRRGRPAMVGTDMAGTVEAVGDAVTDFKPGDEVLGAADGSFADYVSIGAAAMQKNVVPKPAGVSFADAGTLAVAGSTALQALRDHGHMRKGQRVLVNGASGGVGTFAVQIACALGGDVTAVCSTRNVDLVRSIGATTVIDYTKDDFTRSGERYDLMLDVAGSHSWSECTRVLTREAIYVAVGAASVQHGKGGSWRALSRLAGLRMIAIRSDRRIVLFIAKLRKDDLELLGRLVASGDVKPVIEASYDLAAAPEALRRIGEGHLQGKLAISI